MLARELTMSHGWLAAMLPQKVKFNQGDGIESKDGLISRGSGGAETPS